MRPGTVLEIGKVFAQTGGPPSPNTLNRAAQQADEAPHPTVRQTRYEICNRGPFSNLGQGRVRHYNTGKGPDVETLADRQGPGGDEFPGSRADDGGTENPPLCIGHHFDMPVRLALGLGAVILVIWPAQYPNTVAAVPRRDFGQADLGELRVGEGDPRHEVVVHLRTQPEQRVSDDEPGVVVRKMGELPHAGDVADGIDAPVRGLEPLINCDAVAVVLDAGLFQPETLGVGAAAGRDQEMAALDGLLGIAVADDHLDLRAIALDADDRDAAAKIHALPRDGCEHDAGA